MKNLSKAEKTLRQQLALAVQLKAEIQAEKLIKFSSIGQPPLPKAVQDALIYYTRVGALEAFELLEKMGRVDFSIR